MGAYFARCVHLFVSKGVASGSARSRISNPAYHVSGSQAFSFKVLEFGGMSEIEDFDSESVTPPLPISHDRNRRAEIQHYMSLNLTLSGSSFSFEVQSAGPLSSRYP